jgi:hypothetical protein
MPFKIDDKIVKQAHKCTRDHICLSGNGGLYCKVTYYMVGSNKNDKAALIECPKDQGCPYCQSFGNTHICQCPVRMELFKRYSK